MAFSPSAAKGMTAFVRDGTAAACRCYGMSGNVRCEHWVGLSNFGNHDLCLFPQFAPSAEKGRIILEWKQWQINMLLRSGILPW